MDTDFVTAINDAVSGVATSVTGVLATNLPIVLGVTAAFIGLGLAKRLVRKAAS
jgi:hypothetical protein